MKKVNVSENCIGCGYCVSSCPKYFGFNEEGYSKAIKEDIEEADLKAVEEIKDGCPVAAIEITEDNVVSINDLKEEKKAA
nr:ferredoxin [Bacilli bacterium]